MKQLALLASLFATVQAMGGTIDTLEIYSPSMRKTIRCLTVVPDNYTLQGKPYSVLYLLHGWSGNFAGWLGDAPQIQQHADTYNMIIVCPDGGYDSWYLDSPVDSTVRYETHIVREVVPYIDYYYHTRRGREGRAIAGLSMGGHGAFYLSARNPEVFGAAGSICGGLDLRPWKKNDWDLQGVLGNALTNAENWENHSVVNLVEQLKKGKLHLILDCGLGDFFLPMNRAMHQELIEADVPHEYTERPGEHNGEYWGYAIDFQVLFFNKFFEQ